MTHSASKQPMLSANHQPNIVVLNWLEQLSNACQSNSPSDVAALFEEGGYWRDLISFTWNIKTLEGREAIRDMVSETLRHVQPSH